MAVVKSIARDVHVGDPAIAMSGLVFATSVAIKAVLSFNAC